MPLVPFPEYRPDVSDYRAGHTRDVLNVVPRGDGYGPFPGFAPYSAALPAACRGFFRAVRVDGSIAVFAGTAARLFLMDNSGGTWTDVSKDGLAYTTLAASDNWQFAQFGNFVIAVQANTAPQVYDLTASAAFADLAGAPPAARYISVVGRFVVLSGLVSAPYRIQWSALGDATQWTPGADASDFQDLPDGGVVRGVAGGEYGVILQDNVVRRMSYAPGSPVIFQIERIAEDHGLLGPYSLVRSGARIFYVSAQGFKTIGAGTPQGIGGERVDRTFLAELDTSNLQLLLGAADPRSNRVYWAYKSGAGSGPQFNRLVCYDYALDRFAPIEASGEYLGSMSQPGITLENLDAFAPSLDALTGSLDGYPAAAYPEIAAFGADHRLGFFNGPNLEAILATAEQGTDRRRIHVRGLRPITDAAAVFGAVTRRETQQAAPSLSPESAVNAQGICPQRASTRYARARIRIPAGTSWTFAAGVEPDFAPEGLR